MSRVSSTHSPTSRNESHQTFSQLGLCIFECLEFAMRNRYPIVVGETCTSFKRLTRERVYFWCIADFYSVHIQELLRVWADVGLSNYVKHSQISSYGGLMVKAIP